MTAHRDLEVFLARSREIAKGDGGQAKPEPKSGLPPANSANLLIPSVQISRLARLATPAGENPPAQPPEEWSYRFHERAGFLEHDCGMSRHDAEQRAIDELQGHWRALHPLEPSNPEAGCVQCGSLGGADLVPVLAGKKEHAWVHSRCWTALDQSRRSAALAALCKLIPDLPGSGA